MRKILVLLLVVGILIGTIAASEELSDECFQTDMDFSDGELTGNEYDSPLPCDGGGSGGSGGGTPG